MDEECKNPEKYGFFHEAVMFGHQGALIAALNRMHENEITLVHIQIEMIPREGAVVLNHQPNAVPAVIIYQCCRVALFEKIFKKPYDRKEWETNRITLK
jgi:hypothetical protein